MAADVTAALGDSGGVATGVAGAGAAGTGVADVAVALGVAGVAGAFAGGTCPAACRAAARLAASLCIIWRIADEREPGAGCAPAGWGESVCVAAGCEAGGCAD
ncbi:MAG: hypothetical protein DMG81_12985 [Acidobacteria bacterium]|nr:MAG: hypothetical protein DMG81_12985 [Acidobacteriota bacterium]